jgi:plastocyanin
MNFYKFLIIILFLIYLYNRLDKGPYISQSGTYWKINIQNNQFDKPSLIIKKGDIVEFINKDQIRHTIKTNNMNVVNSPILFQNDTWQYQGKNDNDIIFESSLYSNMNKIVIKTQNDNTGKSLKNQMKNNINEIKGKIGDKIKDKKDNLIKKLQNILK